jgi:hypothetical protein
LIQFHVSPLDEPPQPPRAWALQRNSSNAVFWTIDVKAARDEPSLKMRQPPGVVVIAIVWLSITGVAWLYDELRAGAKMTREAEARDS